MDMDRIKDRIRKLLAVATNDSAATGEIENAMRFAQALMDAHHISAEDAHAAAGAEEVREYGYGESFTSGRSLTTWESTLTHIIGNLCGVKCYVVRNSRKVVGGRTVFGDNGREVLAVKIVWYGEVGDCNEAASLFAEWQQTISAMARIRYGGALRGEGAYYASGFVSAMRDANRKQDPVTVSDECKAIAVRAQAIVKTKQHAASDWLKRQGVKLGSGGSRSSRIGDGSAYGAGRKDGSGAGISRRGRLGGGGSQLAFG